MILSFLNKKRRVRRDVSNLKEEALIKTGREQFKKLVERGTELPIVLM